MPENSYDLPRAIRKDVLAALADAWDEGFVASERHKDYVAMEGRPWRITHPANPYRYLTPP